MWNLKFTSEVHHIWTEEERISELEDNWNYPVWGPGRKWNEGTWTAPGGPEAQKEKRGGRETNYLKKYWLMLPNCEGRYGSTHPTCSTNSKQDQLRRVHTRRHSSARFSEPKEMILKAAREKWLILYKEPQDDQRLISHQKSRKPEGTFKVL